MDAEFWHRKWALNEIGFHEGTPNPLLAAHFGALSLAKGSRLFLPLCGKTLDIGWLLARGYRVCGVELSKLAVGQLFAELAVAPEIAAVGRMTRYSAANIDIFAGDIFELTRRELGPVDAVYDRAALIALPEAARSRYATHLMAIADRVPQLLVTLDYDQSLIAGPPFSVDRAEIGRHYAPHYEIARLAGAALAGGLKGKIAASENVWLLTKR